MKYIAKILTSNNYLIFFLLVSIGMCLSYPNVVSILTDQTPWFTVQASELTLNVILLYGLVGVMIDKNTKHMSKWKGWTIAIIAFIVLTLIFVFIGGFNVRGINVH